MIQLGPRGTSSDRPRKLLYTAIGKYSAAAATVSINFCLRHHKLDVLFFDEQKQLSGAEGPLFRIPVQRLSVALDDRPPRQQRESRYLRRHLCFLVGDNGLDGESGS
jgi:hypothetical protein